jgi:hypothetical protein
METVIPIGKFVPYTIEDISVVIPQASQYVKRIKWFLEQYVAATPAEVIANTWVIYDSGDTETLNEITKYGVHGLVVSPPQSTYKMEFGFDKIKTRLAVRMHNDVYCARDDWTQLLVDRFNTSPVPQIISYFNPSGFIAKEIVDRVLEYFPSFANIYKDLEFKTDELNRTTVDTPFLGGFFMAAQSSVFKTIYPLVVEINDGSMNKEDCLTTILASLFNVNIVQWNNIFEFLKTASAAYGDFEDEKPPVEPETKVTDENREYVLKPVFTQITKND